MANVTFISLPPRVVHLENLVDAQFGLEIAGVLLYIYTVYVFLTSRYQIFRHAFYDLFNIGAVFDITLLLAIIFMRVRKRVGLCEGWELWTRISNALTGTNFIVHVYINLLVAFNRFTAVGMPMRHDGIWVRKNYRILCLLLIVTSFGSQCYLFFAVIPFLTIGNNCVPNIKDEKLARILSVVSVGLFQLECWLLSPLTIYFMCQARHKYGQKNKRKRQETNLAFFTSIKSICFCCELLYEIVNLFDISMNNFFFEFINNQFWTYFYLLIFLNCPTLLLLSPTLRKEIYKRWKNPLPLSSSGAVTVFVKPQK